MATWYTADLHLNHANIIRYCDRPFHSAGEMTGELIRRWNRAVSPSDTVWMLGDLALGGEIEKTIALTATLHGRKLLIPGNHDRVSSVYEGGDQKQRFRPVYEAAGWEILPETVESEIGGHDVVLSHYPYQGDTQAADRFASVRPVDDGRPIIHGHVHDEFAQIGRQFNVGVDVREFTPVAEDRVIAWLESL